MPEADARIVTACLIVIGNEILCGRTRDANIHELARRLDAAAIRLREVRIVPDEEAEIVAALDACRARYDLVFTSGGIGPTHDDITAECVARAFGVPLLRHPEAAERLARHYGAERLNEARLRMARVPEGGTLIDNPVSAAPGFRIGNVLVLAGVPSVMSAMLDGVIPTLAGGDPMIARTVSCSLGEGVIADGLAAIQDRFAAVSIGSYPYFRNGFFGVSLVLRGTVAAEVEAATAAVGALIRDLGGEPVVTVGTGD